MTLLTFIFLNFAAALLCSNFGAAEVKLGTVQLPLSSCPPAVVDVAREQLNALREAQKANSTAFKSIKPLKHSKEMSDSAQAWITTLAASLQKGLNPDDSDNSNDQSKKNRNLKPNYPTAGQYIAGKSVNSRGDGRGDLGSSIDLSDLNILEGWSDLKLIDRKPQYTGDSQVRPFYDEEWRRTVEFGVGCAGWQQEVQEEVEDDNNNDYNNNNDYDYPHHHHGRRPHHPHHPHHDHDGSGGRTQTVTKNFFRVAIYFRHPPKKEMAFAKVPSSGCPPIVNSAALTGFNERRARESLSNLIFTTEMSNAAAEWLADATDHPDYKPDYRPAGQYVVLYRVAKENHEIDLSGLDVFDGWVNGRNQGRPLYSGRNGGELKPFTAREWANTLNFGYACVAVEESKEYAFKLAVFFKYPDSQLMKEEKEKEKENKDA